ncbi:hypothetical protein [Pseudomonas aeruginosa]|uniref:hypothetical protein n=2 Tax=Pseudomonas aeruginosa TaxID=287 RepID=UPI00046D260B|nr:hypothetical protein [Pseudomonas aeruginosa]KSH94425.1 hypothetical protein AO979_16120 [Pseudomonas aeruginosa]MBG4003534.1 hypothetical protein [Pseudomonas aeruginosa]MCO1684972.1 hypothetical protein [Pseudomonas aeruginosa]MCO1703149.1 hypothetical protein [Pseudomonas aeruginosa]MCO1716352.1 hypothetical protein [Pseudomonas aeruginosa]
MTSPHATLVALIPHLRGLLTTGFMPDIPNECDGSALLRDLAHPVEANGAGNQGIGKGAQDHLGTGTGWIISQRLLAVRPALASDAELLCSLLARKSEVRLAWLAIAAARCKEAGEMATLSAAQGNSPLVELVSGLGPAAAWVEAALEGARLTASPYAALERELLGVSFEQASATPALVRILAVTAQLAAFADVLPPLPKVDASGIHAQQNWVTGRLLALPVVLDLSEQKPAIDAHVILQGGLMPAIPEGQTTMNWVLAQPWALLLAMLVFAQDAWRAENRGGLLLELPAGQNAFAPAEIAVTVIGTEGDEVRCGTLADLLLGMLARLGVACFPQPPSASELNALLSPLVGLLLKHAVWRYQDGASNQLGQFQIHPQFSDQCYSLPASRVFNRTGKLLWQAARLAAEALYQDYKKVYQHRSVREPEAAYVVQGEPTA